MDTDACMFVISSFSFICDEKYVHISDDIQHDKRNLYNQEFDLTASLIINWPFIKMGHNDGLVDSWWSYNHIISHIKSQYSIYTHEWYMWFRDVMDNTIQQHRRPPGPCFYIQTIHKSGKFWMGTCINVAFLLMMLLRSLFECVFDTLAIELFCVAHGHRYDKVFENYRYSTNHSGRRG